MHDRVVEQPPFAKDENVVSRVMRVGANFPEVIETFAQGQGWNGVASQYLNKEDIG
jgi:hypothetical protein